MDNLVPLISLDENTEINDYTQSANTLFHFMQKQNYLKSALSRKALLPRYCRESVDYLHLHVDGEPYNEIAVLGKCFCDIPLHKIATDFDFVVADESKAKFKKSKKSLSTVGNNHPSYYGMYAIAFSKNWCEENNLQPVHYLNASSSYAKSLGQMFNDLVLKEDMPDEYSDDILVRLALIKPLRGKMKRVIGNDEIVFIKNFHDEQEWRYIPDKTKLDALNKRSISTYNLVVADKYSLGMKFSQEPHLVRLSDDLEKTENEDIWLKFDYKDIRYIVVPKKQDRLELIQYITELHDSNFIGYSDIMLARLLLISKILVFDEIRKDW